MSLKRELAKTLLVSVAILVAALFILNLIALRFPAAPEQFRDIFTNYGLPGVFVAILVGSTLLPFPTDLFYLSVVKLFGPNFLQIIVIGIVAAFIAGLINYGIGALIRRGVAKWLIDEKTLHKAKVWMDAWGAWAILIFGVLPISAVIDPLTIVAGFGGMELRKYVPVMLLARIIHFGGLALFATYF